MDSQDIYFEDILSSKTTFGLIWKGRLHLKGLHDIPKGLDHTLKGLDDTKCVIKMLILKSGIVYSDKTSKYFDENEKVPFYHKEFKRLEPVSKDYFYDEVKGMKKLYKLGLAPKIFSHFIEKRSGIHYGFIVMERMHYSLRDVLIRRGLSSVEKKMILKLINEMHSHKITHGDLKPGNIGIDLNHDSDIIRCKIFDCQNVRDNADEDDDTLVRRVKRDLVTYEKHYRANRKLCD